MEITLDFLQTLKTDLETLTDTQAAEILLTLHKHGIKLNTTKTGIYINLTPMAPELLALVRSQTTLIIDREKTLSDIQKQTDEYKQLRHET